MALGDFLTESVINQNLSSVGFTVQQRTALKTLFDSVNSQLSSIALNDLADVDTTGVTDGEQLTYVDANGQWEPGDPNPA